MYNQMYNTRTMYNQMYNQMYNTQMVYNQMYNQMYNKHITELRILPIVLVCLRRDFKANRAATQSRRFNTGSRTFLEFFDYISRSYGQILMVAHKSNTTSSGASIGTIEVSRKNRFGFQFWLQSFFHDMQNVKFAEKLEKSQKIHRIRIGNHSFVKNWWCMML